MDWQDFSIKGSFESLIAESETHIRSSFGERPKLEKDSVVKHSHHLPDNYLSSNGSSTYTLDNDESLHMNTKVLDSDNETPLIITCVEAKPFISRDDIELAHIVGAAVDCSDTISLFPITFSENKYTIASSASLNVEESEIDRDIARKVVSAGRIASNDLRNHIPFASQVNRAASFAIFGQNTRLLPVEVVSDTEREEIVTYRQDKFQFSRDGLADLPPITSVFGNGLANSLPSHLTELKSLITNFSGRFNRRRIEPYRYDRSPIENIREMCLQSSINRISQSVEWHIGIESTQESSVFLMSPRFSSNYSISSWPTGKVLGTRSLIRSIRLSSAWQPSPSSSSSDTTGDFHPHIPLSAVAPSIESILNSSFCGIRVCWRESTFGSLTNLFDFKDDSTCSATELSLVEAISSESSPKKLFKEKNLNFQMLSDSDALEVNVSPLVDARVHYCDTSCTEATLSIPQFSSQAALFKALMNCPAPLPVSMRILILCSALSGALELDRESLAQTIAAGLKSVDANRLFQSSALGKTKNPAPSPEFKEPLTSLSPETSSVSLPLFTGKSVSERLDLDLEPAKDNVEQLEVHESDALPSAEFDAFSFQTANASAVEEKPVSEPGLQPLGGEFLPTQSSNDMVSDELIGSDVTFEEPVSEITVSSGVYQSLEPDLAPLSSPECTKSPRLDNKIIESDRSSPSKSANIPSKTILQALVNAENASNDAFAYTPSVRASKARDDVAGTSSELSERASELNRDAELARKRRRNQEVVIRSLRKLLLDVPNSGSAIGRRALNQAQSTADARYARLASHSGYQSTPMGTVMGGLLGDSSSRLPVYGRSLASTASSALKSMVSSAKLVLNSLNVVLAAAGDAGKYLPAGDAEAAAEKLLAAHCPRAGEADALGPVSRNNVETCASQVLRGLADEAVRAVLRALTLSQLLPLPYNHQHAQAGSASFPGLGSPDGDFSEFEGLFQESPCNEPDLFGIPPLFHTLQQWLTVKVSGPSGGASDNQRLEELTKKMEVFRTICTNILLAYWSAFISAIRTHWRRKFDAADTRAVTGSLVCSRCWDAFWSSSGHKWSATANGFDGQGVHQNLVEQRIVVVLACVEAVTVLAHEETDCPLAASSSENGNQSQSISTSATPRSAQSVGVGPPGVWAPGASSPVFFVPSISMDKSKTQDDWPSVCVPSRVLVGPLRCLPIDKEAPVGQMAVSFGPVVLLRQPTLLPCPPVCSDEALAEARALMRFLDSTGSSGVVKSSNTLDRNVVYTNSDHPSVDDIQFVVQSEEIASPVRQTLSLSMALADARAFIRSNPHANGIDFLRWYCPFLWLPRVRSGFLVLPLASDRQNEPIVGYLRTGPTRSYPLFPIHAGSDLPNQHPWRRIWDAAVEAETLRSPLNAETPEVSAPRQLKPIFSPAVVAEGALQWLEMLPASSLVASFAGSLLPGVVLSESICSEVTACAPSSPEQKGSESRKDQELDDGEDELDEEKNEFPAEGVGKKECRSSENCGIGGKDAGKTRYETLCNLVSSVCEKSGVAVLAARFAADRARDHISSASRRRRAPSSKSTFNSDGSTSSRRYSAAGEEGGDEEDLLLDPLPLSFSTAVAEMGSLLQSMTLLGAAFADAELRSLRRLELKAVLYELLRDSSLADVPPTPKASPAPCERHSGAAVDEKDRVEEAKDFNSEINQLVNALLSKSYSVGTNTFQRVIPGPRNVTQPISSQTVQQMNRKEDLKPEKDKTGTSRLLEHWVEGRPIQLPTFPPPVNSARRPEQADGVAGAAKSRQSTYEPSGVTFSKCPGCSKALEPFYARKPSNTEALALMEEFSLFSKAQPLMETRIDTTGFNILGRTGSSVLCGCFSPGGLVIAAGNENLLMKGKNQRNNENRNEADSFLSPPPQENRKTYSYPTNLLSSAQFEYSPLVPLTYLKPLMIPLLRFSQPAVALSRGNGIQSFRRIYNGYIHDFPLQLSDSCPPDRAIYILESNFGSSTNYANSCDPAHRMFVKLEYESAVVALKITSFDD